jgi:putative hydrolase of the HAD superfamily
MLKQDRRQIAAVLLDALGTMVELDPPWEHLGPSLGLDPHDPALVAAVRAEMSYYRDHSHEGTDPESLEELRGRCAALISRQLGREVEVETMMAAIRFRAYPDAAPALEELRARGLRLVCVSNWDCSLPGVLAECGLAGLLDGVVSSAGSGSRKPDPAIFEAGLAIAGCEPGQAIHVGDTQAEDVVGARAAGVTPVLIGRDGGGEIASLAELAPLLETMGP